MLLIIGGHLSLALRYLVSQLNAYAGKSRQAPKSISPLPVKPGSAGKAMPGFDVRIVDEAGKEVDRGNMGNIVLAMPLAPTGFRTLWQDEKRFYKDYLKRFNGQWIDTRDADGYISIMSRSDDISKFRYITASPILP
jgi:propionyl-CoA synthetase